MKSINQRILNNIEQYRRIRHIPRYVIKPMDVRCKSNFGSNIRIRLKLGS